MTREQYETAIKNIMQATSEQLKRAKKPEEAAMIMLGQNIALQGVVNAYTGLNEALNSGRTLS